MSRPTWDDWFIGMAKQVADRSVCFRTKLGAVIVKDGKYPISMGYNGAPSGQKNCAEIGFCFRDERNIKSGTQIELCRASGSHAESNAIAIAARLGHPTEGATLYLHGKSFVCEVCKGIISNAGIKRVVISSETGVVTEIIPSRDWTVHFVDKMDNDIISKEIKIRKMLL